MNGKKIWSVIFGFCCINVIFDVLLYAGYIAYIGLENIGDLSLEGGWLFYNYLMAGIVVFGGPVKNYIQCVIKRIKKKREKANKRNKNPELKVDNKVA